MAGTINYTISTTLYSSGWSGSFILTAEANLTSLVSSFNDISSITYGAGLDSFTTVQFEMYPTDLGINAGRTYVTWRSIAYPDQQFPESGISFDIWSENLYNAINSGASWQTLITTGTYSLSSTKNTLVYNYDPSYAILHGTGASSTITFTEG